MAEIAGTIELGSDDFLLGLEFGLGVLHRDRFMEIAGGDDNIRFFSSA